MTLRTQRKTGLVKKDLFEALSHYWGSIDKRYKVAFFTALLINIAVYLVFIVHQPMHNHGILPRLLYTSPDEQFPAGRWFSVVIFHLFNSANLMVVLPLVTIVLHISGGMMATHLWDKKSSTLTLTAGALLVSLYPAVMTSFNFSFVGPIFSGPHLLAPLALLAVSSQRWTRIGLGAVIVCVMMATYQPGLSMILTIFMAFLIVRSLTIQEDSKDFIVFLKADVLPKAIAMAVGVLLYKFSLPVFGIAASQTTSTVSLADVPEKFLLTFKSSFEYLIITQPEFLLTVKLTLLIMSVTAFLTLCFMSVSRSSSAKQAISKIVLLSVLYLFFILSTKGMYFVSANENFWNYRYNHALGYFYMFGFFILLSFWRKGFYRNIVYLILIFVLLNFSFSDIARQQVLYRAQTHHLAIANRILYRIETLPNIDYQKKYRVVRLGNFSEFQSAQLKSRGRSYQMGGDEHLDRELSPIWGPGDIFNYLGSKIILEGYWNRSFREDMELAKELVKDRNPWPADDSVFIHEDMIIVYMSR